MHHPARAAAGTVDVQLLRMVASAGPQWLVIAGAIIGELLSMLADFEREGFAAFREAWTALDALLRGADLLLTSSRPSALARLGLGWGELHVRHPELAHVAQALRLALHCAAMPHVVTVS